MIQFKKAMFLGAALFALAAIGAETNLFPVGEFDWAPEDCDVRTELKAGRYSCAMFLFPHDQTAKKFMFFYRDNKPDSGACEISLDPKTSYRDAKLAVKFDFEQIKPNILHRPSFLVSPRITMEKGATYEATVYIKGNTPGQQLSLSLMGHFMTADNKKKMIYKFVPFITSTLWQPVTVDLAMSQRKDAVSADISSLAIDAKTAGTFHVGKVVIVKKP
jgi:hypothetical protein